LKMSRTYCLAGPPLPLTSLWLSKNGPDHFFWTFPLTWGQTSVASAGREGLRLGGRHRQAAVSRSISCSSNTCFRIPIIQETQVPFCLLLSIDTQKFLLLRIACFTVTHLWDVGGTNCRFVLCEITNSASASQQILSKVSPPLLQLSAPFSRQRAAIGHLSRL